MSIEPCIQVTVGLAQPCNGEPAKRLLIQGETAIEFADHLIDQYASYKSQAKRIVDALCATLPGGTIDQIHLAFCSRKASGLIVADNRWQ